MLNEIRIYFGPFKEIQDIYTKVLHEAFVFVLMSLAGESFANTNSHKQLAINGSLAIHARRVKKRDIRLENIMLKIN